MSPFNKVPGKVNGVQSIPQSLVNHIFQKLLKMKPSSTLDGAPDAGR